MLLLFLLLLFVDLYVLTTISISSSISSNNNFMTVFYCDAFIIRRYPSSTKISSNRISLLLSLTKSSLSHSFISKETRMIIQDDNNDSLLTGWNDDTTIANHENTKNIILTSTAATISSSSSSSLETSSVISSEKQSLYESIGTILLHYALNSPIWKYIMIPMARSKIIQTAYENNILWNECYQWLYQYPNTIWNTNSTSSNVTTNMNPIKHYEIIQNYFHHYLNEYYQNNNNNNNSSSSLIWYQNIRNNNNNNCIVLLPEWYRIVSYHAYEYGHLSWISAIESEIASAAIGARNIPLAKQYGEYQFRTLFTNTIKSYYNSHNNISLLNDNNSIVLDIGCATGISTRWIGENHFPKNRYNNNITIIGIDLSPYNIIVAQTLQQIQPNERKHNNNNNGTWISNINHDHRIIYDWMDGTNTIFHNNSIDIINIQFVAHELPNHITCQMINEASRILKKNGNGQLWFSEMDFQSPAYKKQRSNPLLFSLLRATEPYLDDYANHFSTNIIPCLLKNFYNVTILPVTGRHYTIIANYPIPKEYQQNEQGTWIDLRFDKYGNYRVEDTHLQLWENKK